MIRALLARLQQGHRTSRFPAEAPVLPERFRGRPQLKGELCADDCHVCRDLCPTDAIATAGGKGLRIDLGRCLFCGACETGCPKQAVSFTRDYRLAVRKHEALVTGGQSLELAEALGASLRKLLGRSLKLREVSAGGCNACEADTNVLNTLFFDLGRFGIQFVASPRHADGIFITGPVTKNMLLALKKTYAAIPDPKIVIAAGACAISGGLFRDHPETMNGANSVIPVDLYIPGCPPHPFTILDGLLRLLGKITD